MTEAKKIVCPSCKTEISVDDVLHTQIENRIRKEYEAKTRQKEADFEAKKLEFAKREKELESTIADAVKEKSAKMEKDIREQAKLDAEKDSRHEIERYKSREAELETKLTASRDEQVKLMDEKRKLQDEKESWEIEKREQLDKMREEANRKVDEKYKTITAQKDKALSDATKTIEDLQRKLSQGSQQSQGEVAELNLEEGLRRTFPRDTIESVPKGQSGADIIQKIRNNTGGACGQIIWEVKNTKAWSEGWIQKLKDDQREIHAEVAIIVSRVLPEGVNGFAPRDGVWVCDTRFALQLASVIRDWMEAVTREKGMAISKNESLDFLYRYLTGVQFKQRIEAIYETFTCLKESLDKEKAYFEKKWATQEKQIEKIMKNTIGVYGDIDGIIRLPKISALELEYDPTSEEEVEF